MPPNPYQSPTAMVVDIPRSIPPRPRSVSYACYLVLASLVLGFVTLLPGVDIPHNVEGGVQGAIVWTVYALLQAVALCLTYSTYRRSHWARWALAAYLIFGWLLDALGSTTPSEESALASAVYVAVAVMQVAAIWLLFTGPSAKWFSERNAAVSAEA